jgi:pectate lyase
MFPFGALAQGFATFKQPTDTVIVTTPGQFKSAIANSKPLVVIVRGELKGTGIYYSTSNKLIRGLKGATITGITLGLATVENIKIQNLIFRYQVSDPCILVKYNSKNITVDHCEFYHDRLHGWDYWGKHISITRGSDMVTISYCKFHDANLSVLIGGGDDAANVQDDFGKLHVTMHHNYFYYISEREPSIVTGSLHMYNNYHLNNSGYSIGVRNSAQAIIDGDVFYNCKRPITTVFSGEIPGFVGENKTNYTNSGANQISTPALLWAAPYKFTIMSSTYIRAYIPSHTGATL